VAGTYSRSILPSPLRIGNASPVALDSIHSSQSGSAASRSLRSLKVQLPCRKSKACAPLVVMIARIPPPTDNARITMAHARPDTPKHRGRLPTSEPRNCQLISRRRDLGPLPAHRPPRIRLPGRRLPYRDPWAGQQCTCIVIIQCCWTCLEVEVRTTLALDDDLVLEAQRLTGTNEKSALVRLALRALVERESARRLAQLGGSEPAATAIARRQTTPA
jgi:Arc/MetJ family transcription regulator